MIEYLFGFSLLCLIVLAFVYTIKEHKRLSAESKSRVSMYDSIRDSLESIAKSLNNH